MQNFYEQIFHTNHLSSTVWLFEWQLSDMNSSLDHFSCTAERIPLWKKRHIQ